VLVVSGVSDVVVIGVCRGAGGLIVWAEDLVSVGVVLRALIAIRVLGLGMVVCRPRGAADVSDRDWGGRLSQRYVATRAVASLVECSIVRP
jgi:hypothetical protein